MRGRPVVEDRESLKTYQRVLVNLNKKGYEALKKESEVSGLTMSAIVRRALHGYLKMPID